MNRILVYAFLIISVCASAQFDPTKVSHESPISKVDVGLGAGLDYGGFGGRLTYYPDPHFGAFGSVGYTLVGTGYNIGIKGLIRPFKYISWSAGAMYGYNSVLKVSGINGFSSKTYYGPSLLVGALIHESMKRKNHISAELIFPLRSSDYTNTVNALQSNPNVDITAPLPFAISVGYHWGL